MCAAPLCTLVVTFRVGACLKRYLSLLALLLFFVMSKALSAQTQSRVVHSPDARYRVGPLLYRDGFRNDLKQWAAEEEKPGQVEASGGVLNIDVPAGLTLWFRPKLEGRVMITYDATVISNGGPNDNVTDLNCFWMASDPAHPNNVLAGHRTGKFADYNDLLTYYVGVGGRGNKTTRFRRYVGSKTDRPLRPQDDLSAPEDMIVPNQKATIELVADGPLIQYFRNGRKVFEMLDPQPYTSGWFGLRTVHNHMQVRNLRIYRIIPVKTVHP